MPARDVIGQLRRCRVIARFGIGVDMIDLDAATERGILVCNTATYCLDEVSNHAMGLLLMLTPPALELDMIPIVGELDWILVGYLALKVFIWLCPPDVVREHVSQIARGE